jgi:hypothetical protein
VRVRTGAPPSSIPSTHGSAYRHRDKATWLTEAKVTVLREAEDMPWGERIASVADPEGKPRRSLPDQIAD